MRRRTGSKTHRQHRLTRLSALALVAALACTPRSPYPRQPADSPTLRVGVRLRLADFNPLRGSQLNDAYLSALLFDGLVNLDDSGDLIPGLARSWTLSRDGRTYRFQLRTGVRFHDGSPFAARDVERAWTQALREPADLFTHPWMLDPIVGAADVTAGRTATLAGVRTVNDSTIDVTLTEPLAPFIPRLSLQQAAIPAASNTPEHPVGTGPWRWVRGRAGDDEVWFARNGEHWTPPQMDSLVRRYVPDSLYVQAFDAGWIDFVNAIVPSLRTSLSAQPTIGFARSQPASAVELKINLRDSRLADPRVRQALREAIDTRALAAAIAGEDGVAATGPVPPTYLGVPDSASPPVTFNPQHARALLAEAGVRLDQPLRLTSVGSEATEYPRRLGPLLANYLEAVGLKVTLTTIPVNDVGGWGPGSDDDLLLLTWYPDFADADTYLGVFLSSVAAAGGNLGGYADRATDSLIRASRRTTDSAKRLGLVRAANARIYAQTPDVYLWFHRSLTAYSLRLAGWKASPYPARFADVYLVAAGRP